MNLNYLTYFVTVAELKSFTKASEDLSITQPTLSISIIKLEKNLGVKLFNRTKKGQKASITLTDAGEIFLSKSKDILSLFELAKVELYHNYSNTKILKLGTLPSISLNLINELIINIRETFPYIIIEQVTGDSLELEEWFKQGVIDIELNIFSLEKLREKKRKETFKILFDRNYIVAVSQKHPLAEKSNFSIEELNEIPYIDRTRCEIRPHLHKVFKERKISPKVTGRTQHDFLADSLVASGAGVAVIPERKIPGIITLPFSDFCISRSVGLKWKENEESTIIDFFVNLPVSVLNSASSSST